MKARNAALQVSGVAPLYARVARPRVATILCYHSVAADEAASCVDPRWRLSPRQFDAHARFLAAERRVVSLSALVERLVAGEAPEPATVAIAFDDGYRDNLTVAAPILAKYRLPATLFLATGHVDRGEAQFVDRLYTYWTRRTRERICLPGLDADLRDPGQRARCFRELNARLIVADHDQRADLLASLAAQLGVPQELPARLTLTWDEARELVRSFPRFEVGVHSVNHLDLVTHAHRADDELCQSRARVASALGVTPQHHSFPFGRSTPLLRARVRQLGFASACADRESTRVAQGSDPFWLGRVYPTPSLTLLKFHTSGVASELRRLPW
ncbi:MAG: polysaccharide deacetylase family protein [Planctomycetes bacterium]|nr:polysaccharide deacetylase family protein [Planctomycetota bacterium]